jgi:signal peptidase I
LKKLRSVTPSFGSRAFLVVALLFGTLALRTAARALVTSDYFNLIGRVGLGHSMELTLQPHDVILMDTEGKDDLKRGDVVSFIVPSGEIYCKRAIAMAGETVRISNGRVYVNNQKITGLPFDRLYYMTALYR